MRAWSVGVGVRSNGLMECLASDLQMGSANKKSPVVAGREAGC